MLKCTAFCVGLMFTSFCNASTVTLTCPEPLNAANIQLNPNCNSQQPWCRYLYSSEFIEDPANALANTHMEGQGSATEFYNMTIATWTDNTFLCWYHTNTEDQVICSIDLSPYVKDCNFLNSNGTPDCTSTNPWECSLVCTLKKRPKHVG